MIKPAVLLASLAMLASIPTTATASEPLGFGSTLEVDSMLKYPPSSGVWTPQNVVDAEYRPTGFAKEMSYVWFPDETYAARPLCNYWLRTESGYYPQNGDDVGTGVSVQQLTSANQPLTTIGFSTHASDVRRWRVTSS